MEKDWMVYLLRCNDGTFYCGATNNMEKRLKAHNSQRGAKYTSTRAPSVIEAVSVKMCKSDALKFERKVKNQKRCDKVRFLSSLK